MAIDLLKLEKRFIDLLENTTQEEFEQWLLSKTESKPTQQTAVEQLVNYMKDNFHLTDESLEKFEQAKRLEKDQIEDAQMDMFNHINRMDYGLDYLNKWDAALKYAEDYYTRLQNQTN